MNYVNYVPLVLAALAVIFYILAVKLVGPPSSAQANKLLKLAVMLIVVALIIAAVWPIVARGTPAH